MVNCLLLYVLTAQYLCLHISLHHSCSIILVVMCNNLLPYRNIKVTAAIWHHMMTLFTLLWVPKSIYEVYIRVKCSAENLWGVHFIIHLIILEALINVPLQGNSTSEDLFSWHKQEVCKGIKFAYLSNSICQPSSDTLTYVRCQRTRCRGQLIDDCLQT